MTREKQAKKDCAIIVDDCVESGTIYASGYNKGIEMGVKWADTHHNWHKYPDEKPPKSKTHFTEKYLVMHKIFGKQETIVAKYFVHPNGYTSAWIDNHPATSFQQIDSELYPEVTFENSPKELVIK